MDTQNLLEELNLFYSLELQQVDIYTIQSKQVQDEYLRQALQRIAFIEQQHVDNIGAKIKELGGKPGPVFDVVSPLVGKLLGRVSAITGVRAMLQINIELEEKAMKRYRDLMLQVPGDQELFQLLWSNMIDEDLHTAWFAQQISQMKSDRD